MHSLSGCFIVDRLGCVFACAIVHLFVRESDSFFVQNTLSGLRRRIGNSRQRKTWQVVIASVKHWGHELTNPRDISRSDCESPLVLLIVPSGVVLRSCSFRLAFSESVGVSHNRCDDKRKRTLPRLSSFVERVVVLPSMVVACVGRALFRDPRVATKVGFGALFAEASLVGG